jgi:hypothetical protein
MRMIRLHVLLITAIFGNTTFLAADEPAPLKVNLRPQMLSLSPTAKIELTCELTNTSDKPISVDWNTPWLTMFPRQINVAMSDGSMSRKVKLAAGESHSLPVVIRLGEDLPALDEGDYDLVFNVAMDAAGKRRHLRASLPLTIVARDDEKPATTAESLAAAAREYAIRRGDAGRLSAESYLIRRRGNGWDVELTVRSGKRVGSMTVSLDANGEGAHVLPIP